MPTTASELDTITFLNCAWQYFSPWAKLNYATPHGFIWIWSSRPEMRSRTPDSAVISDVPLQNELAQRTLSVLPELAT